jgi:hypothetical protein
MVKIDLSRQESIEHRCAREIPEKKTLSAHENLSRFAASK